MVIAIVIGGKTIRTNSFIKNALMIVFLLDISICNASTTGQAKLTAGLSADNKDVYKGIAIDYSLQSDSHIQSWSTTFNYDYSDAENRPSAISGHQYLYSTSAISAGFSHEIKTRTPFVVWNTGGDYRQSGEVDISGNRRYNWSSFTGPRFNKNIRQDISVGINIIQGLQFVNDEYAYNTTWDMQLTKRFTGMVSLGAQVQQECWEYDETLLEDNCRDSYNLVYSAIGSSSDLRISLGQTLMNDQAEMLYGIGLTYQLNSINSLSISSERRNRTFKDIVVSIDNSAIASTIGTSVNIHTVSYSRQVKRILFSADITKTIYKDDESNSNTDINMNGNTEEQERSVSASYLFSNKICLYCSLEYQYIKSQQVINNWTSWNLGIKYPFKKNMNGLLSLRQTTQDTGENITSINLQLNYDGKTALVGR